MTGLVVKFDEAKGYGFIRDTGAPEGHLGTIFFHHTDVVTIGKRYVGAEMVANKTVEFDIEKTETGRHRARNVRVVDNGR